VFEMAHNLVLNKNGAILTHMSYLKCSILKNKLRNCKQSGANLTHMSYLKYSILKNELRNCKQPR
jgi:hypothetical protein